MSNPNDTLNLLLDIYVPNLILLFIGVSLLAITQSSKGVSCNPLSLELSSWISSWNGVVVSNLYYVLMSLLILFNLSGLFSSVSMYSTLFYIILVFSLSYWFSGVVILSLYNKITWWAHLIPSGSPVGMSPILFVIEVFSTIIRPISLIVRILVNLSISHLFVFLVGIGVTPSLWVFDLANYLCSFYPVLISYVEVGVPILFETLEYKIYSKWFSMVVVTILFVFEVLIVLSKVVIIYPIVMILISVVVFLFEVIVSLIQAYVFSILLENYLE